MLWSEKKKYVEQKVEVDNYIQHDTNLFSEWTLL